MILIGVVSMLLALDLFLWNMSLKNWKLARCAKSYLDFLTSRGISVGIEFTQRICSLALSIRHLVCIGHDVAAKILARSLAEYSDVMALLIVRPDLRSEFQKEDDPEKFWRRHVGRGEARKAILAALPPLTGVAAPWWTEYENFRRAEGKFMTISVHPSYVSAAMNMLAASDENVHWPGFLGRVTDPRAARGGGPDRVHANVGADIDQNVVRFEFGNPIQRPRFLGRDGLDAPSGPGIRCRKDHAGAAVLELAARNQFLILLER